MACVSMCWSQLGRANLPCTRALTVLEIEPPHPLSPDQVVCIGRAAIIIAILYSKRLSNLTQVISLGSSRAGITLLGIQNLCYIITLYLTVGLDRLTCLLN